jgi:hypothetical protein
MKSLPGVCALGIVIVTKRHEEVSAKAIDKRFRASVQCTANLVVKSTRVHQILMVGGCIGI